MLRYAKSAVLSSATVHPDPDAAIAGKRASVAAGVAASEFGRNRPNPNSYSFVDRRPGEIAIIRAGGWRGAAR